MTRAVKPRLQKACKNAQNDCNNKATRKKTKKCVERRVKASNLAASVQPSAAPKQQNAQVNYLFVDKMAGKRKKCGCFRPRALDINADADSDETYTQRYLVGSSDTSLVNIRSVSDALLAVPKPITTEISLGSQELLTPQPQPPQRLSCGNKKKCSCARDDFLLDPTATCKCRLSITTLPVHQNPCFPVDNFSLVSELPIPEELAEPLERNRRTQTSEIFKTERINFDHCAENPHCADNSCPSEAPSMDSLNIVEDDLSVKGSTDYLLFWEYATPNAPPKFKCPYRRKRKVIRTRKVIVPLPRIETECQMLHSMKYDDTEKPFKPKKAPPTLADTLRSWCPLAFKLPPRPPKQQKKAIKYVDDEQTAVRCRKDALFHLRNLNNPTTKQISCQQGCLPLNDCTEQSESKSTPSTQPTTNTNYSNLSIFNFDMNGFL